MGRFDASLLDGEQLFYRLLQGIVPSGVKVVGDLDPNTAAQIPSVMFSVIVAQEGNANGLWLATLTLTFLDHTEDAFDNASEIYKGIYGWEDPTQGIVPGVGAVEEIVQEMTAFSRLGGEVPMETKTVSQYQGSWQFLVRN